jgi:membrane-anchored glycerophosphoryl diester phosphodiesterase (GDPDase)
MNKVSPFAAIKTGWQCAKEHFIVSLGLILAFSVVNVLLSFIPPEGGVGMIALLFNFLLSMVWSLGIVRLSIEVVDGEEPRFGVFKEVLPRLWHFIVLTIIMTIFMLIPACAIIGVGAASCSVSLTTLSAFDPTALSTLSLWMLLACVPAIYISIRLIFAPYLLIDRGVGPVEAIKMSWKASYPVQGRVFIFLILAFLVGLLGVLCFLVGVFVSMIVVIYAQGALYRQVFSAGIQDPLLVEDANVVVG